MPYIKKAQRTNLDKIVQQIVEFNPNPGQFNYLVSKTLWTMFDKQNSYDVANAMIGALECIKLEFYRRRLSGYENEKIVENGDL